MTAATMHVVCAWCQAVMQEGTGPTSHGICPSCESGVSEEIDAMPVAYLERSEEGEHDNVYALRADMVLVMAPGTEWETVVGNVAHRENFHLACDAADEEIRVLMAEARMYG